jgi:hypothetical protein
MEVEWMNVFVVLFIIKNSLIFFVSQQDFQLYQG